MMNSVFLGRTPSFRKKIHPLLEKEKKNQYVQIFLSKAQKQNPQNVGKE